jgi:limonene-1,2-epoxide hydrolase
MDRRRFLQATTVASAAVPAAAIAAAGTITPKGLATVREIILAWRRQDLEAMLTHIDDDIVWHTHVGSPPVIGKAAMRDFATKLGAQMKDIRWRIFEAAQNGNRMHLEGVDDFVTTEGRRVVIPYAGIMVLHEGKVREWRDYFDRATFDKLKAGEPMPDYLAALAGREALF